MPCLNEAETISLCIKKAKDYLKSNQILGEVLVADNGSTDGSIAIARKSGARVVEVKEKGYGSALISGINSAKGTYIVMGDADDSYDFSDLNSFVDKLNDGYDLVVGNRFKGGIVKNAMPPLHRYLGNPVLSFLGRLFYKCNIGDFHCGLRAFKRQSMQKIGLKTTGMEFASEMIVKARLYKLEICEVPTKLYPDGRSRPPHLRSWRDGWRHLNFLLMYSPRWLFLYPGSALFLIGLILMLLLMNNTIRVNYIFFDIHTLLYAAGMIVSGMSVIMFTLFISIYAHVMGFTLQTDKISDKLASFIKRDGLILGILLTFMGLLLSLAAILIWKNSSYGRLNPETMMRLTIPALALILCGINISFSSFFINILSIGKNNA